MKLNDIKKETTQMVLDHIAEGWTLDWSDVSYGCQTCEILAKGDRVRFIFATWERTDHSDIMNPAENAFRVGIAETSIQDRNCCGPWEKEELVVSEKTYYRLADKWNGNGDWYTDSVEEAREATRKRAERYRRTRRRDEPKLLEPSDRLVEILREQSSAFCGKATKKNVRVEKKEKRYGFGPRVLGYEVTLLNRLGNPKEQVFYPLGGRKA